jgi:hypothetical protein
MEKEITVLDDAEFERVAVSWGYDLTRLRAERKSQGQDIEIDSLSRIASGVQWIIMRKSRWEEMQDTEDPWPTHE